MGSAPVRIRAREERWNWSEVGTDLSRHYPTVLSQHAITNYIVSSIITESGQGRKLTRVFICKSEQGTGFAFRPRLRLPPCPGQELEMVESCLLWLVNYDSFVPSMVVKARANLGLCLLFTRENAC